MTGVWKNSETDANVVIIIRGSEAESQPIILQKNMINSITLLARGNEDTFVIHLPMSLGELQCIRIWHDDSGKNPSWFLSHAVVMDRLTGKKWTFLCNNWFALEKGDGKIDRTLTPISPLEMQTFKYSLSSQGSKSFSDGHIWLSVVTKPPRSTFTRVQRATCCLCLLMSAMLANALFYRTDKEADPTIQIGPLKFSWRQIVVGIESALIVTPINLLIITFFKKSAEKPSNKVDVAKPANSPAPVRCNKYSPTGYIGDINDTDVKRNKNKTGWTRVPKRPANAKKDVMLPHFFVYIGWFLSLVTVSLSSVFTFFFSLQWGKDISNQWLSSMFVSFTQDLFVLQPTKVLLIMVLTACLFRDRDGNEASSHQMKTERQLSTKTNSINDTQSIKVEMPQENDLIRAKEYRTKEAKMFSFIKEFLAYLLFILLLTIVCYGSRDYHGYLMTKNLKDTLQDFSLVSILMLGIMD